MFNVPVLLGSSQQIPWCFELRAELIILILPLGSHLKMTGAQLLRPQQSGVMIMINLEYWLMLICSQKSWERIHDEIMMNSPSDRSY